MGKKPIYISELLLQKFFLPLQSGLSRKQQDDFVHYNNLQNKANSSLYYIVDVINMKILDLLKRK